MVHQRRRLRKSIPKRRLVTNPFVDLRNSLIITPPVKMTARAVPTVEMILSASEHEPAEEEAHPIIASLSITPSTITKKKHGGSCSHLNFTRLYTDVHVCSVCEEFGSFGWLYRCTDDRELLIEHDLKSGVEMESIDNLYKLLPKFENPRNWSPEARENSLSLLDEMSEAQFKSYTPAQISILLQQRAHLHKVIQTQLDSSIPSPTSSLLTKLQVLDPSSITAPPDAGPLTTTKPWLPTTECQYKICPRCRPSGREKAFLSLNAVLNDEIPLTALVGFGFHLKGARPVVKSSVWCKIGLKREKGERRWSLRLRRKEGRGDLNGESGNEKEGGKEELKGISEDGDDHDGGDGHTKRPSPLRLFNTSKRIPRSESTIRVVGGGHEDESEKENIPQPVSMKVIDDDNARNQILQENGPNISIINTDLNASSFDPATPASIKITTTFHSSSASALLNDEILIIPAPIEHDHDSENQPNELDALLSIERLAANRHHGEDSSQRHSQDEQRGRESKEIQGDRKGNELGTEPLNVEKGIAVTEESVEMGGADVFVERSK